MYFKENCLLLPYFLLLIIGLVQPSNLNHGLFSLKTLALAGAGIGMLLSLLLKKNLTPFQLKIFCFSVLSLCFLGLWLAIGIFINDTELHLGLDQLKLFLITISVPVITYYFIYENQTTPQMVLKVMIFANMAYCTAKILLIIGHFAGIIDVWNVMEICGFMIQKMTILSGFERLQTSVDITAPFLVYFVLQSNALGIQLSRKTKIFYILISLLSNIFAYSRFLLGVYALGICLYIFTLSAKRAIKSFAVLLIAAAGAFALIGSENLSLAFSNRFFSDSSSFSDQLRVEQTHALMREFYNSPYVGQGIGSYAKEMIRSGGALHSYEVQWIAFLMQFGILGGAILILPILFIFLQLFLLPFSRSKLCLIILYLTWVASGFTNPFLISLQSGILYTLFLLAAETLRTRKQSWRLPFGINTRALR